MEREDNPTASVQVVKDDCQSIIADTVSSSMRPRRLIGGVRGKAARAGPIRGRRFLSGTERVKLRALFSGYEEMPALEEVRRVMDKHREFLDVLAKRNEEFQGQSATTVYKRISDSLRAGRRQAMRKAEEGDSEQETAEED